MLACPAMSTTPHFLPHPQITCQYFSNMSMNKDPNTTASGPSVGTSPGNNYDKGSTDDGSGVSSGSLPGSRNNKPPANTAPGPSSGSMPGHNYGSGALRDERDGPTAGPTSTASTYCGTTSSFIPRHTGSAPSIRNGGSECNSTAGGSSVPEEFLGSHTDSRW
jgi:hypothetical protein